MKKLKILYDDVFKNVFLLRQKNIMMVHFSIN